MIERVLQGTLIIRIVKVLIEGVRAVGYHMTVSPMKAQCRQSVASAELLAVLKREG